MMSKIGIGQKIICSLMVMIFVFSTCCSVNAINNPVGIGGQVLKDGENAAGQQITITNENSGEVFSKTVNSNGYYACGMDANEGDKVIASCTYDGTTFSNFVHVDFSQLTQWLNLSITSGSSNDNGGNGNGGDSTPPSSPHANFAWTPLQPFENESVSFTDLSTDEDNDILSWVWSIDGQTIEQKNVEYIFTNPGNHLISLTVTDSTSHYNTKQATLVVAKINTTANTNDTNSTSTLENITIIITTTDENNNTIANEKIDVYQNSTLIKTGYSDISGQCIFSLSPGSYTFKTGGETKEELFASDGAITFMLGNNVDAPVVENNIFLVVVAIIAIAVISVSIIVFFVRKKGMIS